MRCSLGGDLETEKGSEVESFFMCRIVIDCDPGIDDSLALLLALNSPELSVAAITTVSGNVPAHMGAANTGKVLKRMGRLDIPVYVGEPVPLKRAYVDAMDTHGSDGMGESFFEEVDIPYQEMGAVEYLETLLEQEEISVLALGPMTNLARLARKRPDLLKNIREIISMGGSFKSHGNCSPVAEYNYWCDPEAAAVCFEAFGAAGKKIHMVGLDVTRKIVLTPNLLEYICRLDPDTGEWIRRLTGFYMDFHWKQEGIIGCVINDPLAAAYFVKRSLCSGFDCYTAVETEGICPGQSVADAMNIWKKPANSHVLAETDCKAFMYFFLSRILRKPDGGRYEEEELKLLEVLV